MIYVGTSGYSYADWKGVFYPPDLPQNQWLAFYAREFTAVELDFTYYRMPTADQLVKIAAQTPDHFRFAVKAHQDITHHRQAETTALTQFRAALTPLRQQGQLSAVLLQFPGSFRCTDTNLDYLRRCAEHLPDLPLVIEFRHREWISQRVLTLLRELQVGFCNVDMPALPGLLPRTALVTAPTAYLRLHGRNAKTWWQHDQAWERYNYHYSKPELREWIPHIRQMDAQAEQVLVFANNHWQGQAVETARQIKILSSQSVESADSTAPSTKI